MAFLYFHNISFSFFVSKSIAIQFFIIVLIVQALIKFSILKGNRVNKLKNAPRCGVVPKFSDLKAIAISITTEALGFDSENCLSHEYAFCFAGIEGVGECGLAVIIWR